jgi:starch phosphorylase
MVQGCDIWLNTPRRPLEASGTSGMKAAINGTLNMSVLDGWFPEAYNGSNGFAIGDEREYADAEQQDEIESRQLYRLLEEQVVPTFYTRNAQGVPERWVEMQKEAFVTIGAEFSADRMVQEYAERFYFPASTRFQRLRADGARATRDLITWKRHVLQGWSGVGFQQVSTPPFTHMEAGARVPISAKLALGSLSPADVVVEAFAGPVDSQGEIREGTSTRLEPQQTENGTTLYAGDIVLADAGRTGVTLRAIPSHPDLVDRFEMNIVTWAQG